MSDSITQIYKVAVVDAYTKDINSYHLAELSRPLLVTPTQVEVEVHAASINPIDYKRAEGMLSAANPEKFPLRLAEDVAGVVTKIGSNVTRVKVGDRVYGCLEGGEVGTVGEYVIADEARLAIIPESTTFVEAAGVPLAGMTAFQALERGGLKEGGKLFVSGGLGGVGQFAIPLAKHYFKAAEIATTVSEKKVEKAKEIGATKVVDYNKENYTEALEDFADVVFDTTGDPECYKVAKPNGKVVSIAMPPSGEAFESFRQESNPLSMLGLIKFNIAKLTLDGLTWYNTRSYAAKGVKYEFLYLVSLGKQLEEVFNPLLESGKIKPVISNVYPFTQEGVQSAFNELLDGHATGKIIIKVRN